MRKWLKVSVMMLALFFLVGCAGMQTTKPPDDPFLTGSYRSLATLDTAYDTAWGGFVQLYKDGLVKEETFQAGRKLALDYFDKWTKASKYLLKYAKGEAGEGGFDALKDLANEALKAMKDYLKEKSGGVKPII